MPKFVVERSWPGAGNLPDDDLAEMIQVSCETVKAIGPQIQWIESYVTDDKVYCIYVAPDEDTIRQHAKLGGFPADSVLVVRKMIGSTSVEGSDATMAVKA